MIKKLLSCAAVLMASLAGFLPAQAVPVTYFGEDQTPNGTVTGQPASARASFLSNLTGVGSEGFESIPAGTRADQDPITLSFAGSAGTTLSASLSGLGYVANTPDPQIGRFNTTPGGSQWLEIADEFTITFGTAISAFGFYGTDIGDFNGTLTLNLIGLDGGLTVLEVPHVVDGKNGSLLFFGFIETDPTKRYTSITFGNTSPGWDGFGFDDMVIGDLGQVGTPPVNPVPEPATLALVSLSLLGLAASRRKIRR